MSLVQSKLVFYLMQGRELFFPNEDLLLVLALQDECKRHCCMLPATVKKTQNFLPRCDFHLILIDVACALEGVFLHPK